MKLSRVLSYGTENHPPKRKLSEEEKERIRKIGVEGRKKIAIYKEKIEKKE